MILYNGTHYQDEDVIDWHIALSLDDRYFGLAKNLGLPLPPACHVFVDDHAKTPKQHMISGWYAALLHSAKLDRVLTGKEIAAF